MLFISLQLIIGVSSPVLITFQGFVYTLPVKLEMVSAFVLDLMKVHL